MADALPPRNEIVGIADRGLVLQLDGGERVAAWSSILSVSAAMALVDRTSARRIPVFVIAIMDGADERLFIVGETEPMWEPLASTLPNVLPGMPTADVWGAELEATGKASLYVRAGSVQ